MPSSSRKGFTIIELLVAVGVTALLVTLMVNIVTTVLTNWNRTSGALSTGNQARLVMDQLSQDIQGAILKMDGNVWMAASIQSDVGDLGQSGMQAEDWSGGKPVDDSLNLTESNLSPEEYRFGQAGVWLRFFSIPSGENKGTTDTISAPRAISYQIVRRKVGGTNSEQRVYQLFRSEVLPYSDNEDKAAASTFTVGYDLYTMATPGYMTADSDPDHSGYAGTIRSPNPYQVIASGVVDFGVRFYANSSSGVATEVFPIDELNSGGALKRALAATSNKNKAQPSIPPTPGIQTADISYAFPTVAEITIRVLTPEGERLIGAFEEDNSRFPDESWWDIVIKNSNVYTRRIDIKSMAL